jgi:endonuclease G, mitochondrial
MTDKMKVDKGILVDGILIADDTTKRYNDTKTSRSRVIDTLKKGNIDDIMKEEPKSRIEARKKQLKKEAPELTIERQIGGNDLMPFYWLEKGKKRGESICRIEVIDDNDNSLGYGTGFMISPSLLMTNNHVFSGPDLAKNSLAQFNYEKLENHTEKPIINFRLDPNKFFYTNKELDFSLVYVNPKSIDDQESLDKIGYLKLIKDPGKAVIGEYVTIIQHPRGKPKQIALRENRVIQILDNFVHCLTDTDPGSSGSPVFNDQWDVVSLHHSGVPDRDKQGNILTVDKKVWTDDMGSDKINWIANESIRISAIVAHVKKANIAAQQKKYLDEFLNIVG